MVTSKVCEQHIRQDKHSAKDIEKDHKKMIETIIEN